MARSVRPARAQRRAGDLVELLQVTEAVNFIVIPIADADPGGRASPITASTSTTRMAGVSSTLVHLALDKASFKVNTGTTHRWGGAEQEALDLV